MPVAGSNRGKKLAEICFSWEARGSLGLSCNGRPAALLNKTVCYRHVVFECELRQARKIIPPSSLYSRILNNLDPYVRTKLRASKYLAFSSEPYSTFWKNSLHPNPLSVFTAHPKYAVFHSNSVEICLHDEDVQCKTRTLLRFKQHNTFIK